MSQGTNFDIPEEVLAAHPMLREDWEEQIKQDEQDQAEKSMKSGLSDKEKERREIANLLERGEVFECPTLFRRIFGKKTDKWRIRAMSASTIVRLCEEYLEMYVDEEAVESEGIVYAKHLFAQHGKRMARIVAISVVGAVPVIGNLLRSIMTSYFYARMTPEAFVAHAVRVNQHQSYVDFLTSTRFSQAKRLTQPELVEGKSANSSNKG